MATTKNTPDNKGTEQRGQPTGYGKVGDKPNSANQPGDRSATDETRSGGLPGTQRKGAETTQAGTNERPAGSKGVDGDRTDRDVAGSRSTGQNPTGTREVNERELRDEDEADLENLPAAEDLDAEDEDVETDDATTDEDATTKVK